MKSAYLLLIVLFIAGCGGDDDKRLQTENVIIGQYYGFCQGDCALMFMQEGDNVYPDIITNGYTETPAFSSDAIAVSSDILERFQALASSTPQLLLDEVGGSFGQPDAGDWGAIHYQVGEDSWTLDNFNDNNPAEIQDFVEEIKEIITALR